MVFRKDNGALWSIIHKKSGIDLKTAKTDGWPINWSARLLDKERREAITDSNRSRAFTYAMRPDTGGLSLEMKWSKIFLDTKADYPAEVVVTVTIKDDKPYSLWTTHIANHGPDAFLEMRLPHVTGVTKIGTDGGDDRLVVPDQEGRLFLNPAEYLKNWGHDYPSGFMNMQFMSYYDSRAGFYFAAQDADGYTKGFSWNKPVETWVSLSLTYYPPIQFGSDISLPYEVVVGVFDGDWYTAADIYKKWALEQWWAKEKIIDKSPLWISKMSVGKDFDTYPTAGIERLNIGKTRSYSEFISKIQQHTKFFDLPTIVNLRGWEKGGAWISGDYFPPMEGWDSFDHLVAEAHKVNTRLWLMISANHVTTITDLWKSGEPEKFTIKDKQGNTNFDTNTGMNDAVMCINNEYWQNKLKQYVMTLVERDIDLVQWDGFPWIQPRYCWDETHRHPLGKGGNWYSQAWLKTLKETKTIATAIKPDIAFSGEGGAELFISYLDTYHSRDNWAEIIDARLVPNSAVPIPLFEYVYHEHLLFLGKFNPALWMPLGGHTFSMLGLSRTLVWGQIPDYNMQEDLQSSNVDLATLDYLKKIAQARSTYAYDYLVFGQMIPPPMIDSPKTRVVAEGNKFSGEVSALQYSAWKSPLGHYGLIITNISDNPIRFTIELSTSTMMLPPDESYDIIQYLNGSPTPLQANIKLPGTLDVQIKPQDIILIKFIPSDKVTSPTVITAKATTITSNSVTLNGALSHLGTAGTVEVSFQWGTGTDYGNETDSNTITSPETFDFTITGLKPGTIYHFKAKAIGDESAYGEDMTFTTLAPGTSPRNMESQPNESTNTVSKVGNTIQIAAAIAGSVLLILLCIAVVYRIHKRKRVSSSQR